VADSDHLALAEGDDAQLWSRGQFLRASAGLFVAGAASLWLRPQIVDAARAVFGSPVEHGLVHLYQYDFFFVPNYMTWRVGTPLTVRLHNMSTTRWHEWQMGRTIYLESSVLGVQTANAWKTDFWDGVHVTLSNVFGMDNFAPNEAIVTYIGPKGPYQITPGGDFSPTLKPGGHVDISFVVPNKPGMWEYGCFIQSDVHYRLGMRGRVNILPA
jgi:hypothetical protein